MDELFKGKNGKELEECGVQTFEKIGLKCFGNLRQAQVNKISSGYPEDEHLEFDYLIPENKVCLIGEITGRTHERDIKKNMKNSLGKSIS